MKNEVNSDICRTMADVSPLAIASVEGERHVVRYVNPAFCRLVNKTREELIGNPFSAVVPAEVECLALLDRVYRTGQAETHTGQELSAAQPLYWSYAMWPMLSAEDRSAGIMILVTESDRFHQQAIAMNQALMIGSVHQHELMEATAAVNEQLQRELAERKRIEKQLRESEENLSALLEEKQTLLQEIHHRVKNNLQVIVSLLSLHAEQTNDPLVIEALARAGGRVQAIARVHETLHASDNLAEINFGEYIQHLTHELQQLHSREHVTVQVFTDDIVLGMDTAIPLGLIANELILNCFKHAFPSTQGGRVAVSVKYVGDSVGPTEPLEGAAIRLCVQDSGIGLPPEIDITKTDSLGLRIVQLLGRQLHAHVLAQTGTGLSFTVTVPSPAQFQSSNSSIWKSSTRLSSLRDETNLSNSG